MKRKSPCRVGKAISEMVYVYSVKESSLSTVTIEQEKLATIITPDGELIVVEINLKDRTVKTVFAVNLKTQLLKIQMTTFANPYDGALWLGEGVPKEYNPFIYESNNNEKFISALYAFATRAKFITANEVPISIVTKNGTVAKKEFMLSNHELIDPATGVLDRFKIDEKHYRSIAHQRPDANADSENREGWLKSIFSLEGHSLVVYDYKDSREFVQYINLMGYSVSTMDQVITLKSPNQQTVEFYVEARSEFEEWLRYLSKVGVNAAVSSEL